MGKCKEFNSINEEKFITIISEQKILINNK